MESSYGVGVRNRYEILGDEESDPIEVIEVHEKDRDDKKKKKKELSVDVKDKLKPLPDIIKPKSFAPRKPGKENVEKIDYERRNRIEDVSTQRGSSERGGKFSNFSREDRNNRRNREEQNNVESFSRETAPRFDGERNRGSRGGRGRGRGRGRGGFGQDGFDSRGKREFDRVSGSEKSSVRSFEKRDGGGAHNWGKQTEMDGALDMDSSFNSSDFKHDDSGLETDLVKDEVEKPAEVVEDGEIEVTEEPKEITFQEWKAKQGERQKPSFNIRKAGEGEDNWKKGCTVLQKKVDSDSEYEEDEDWVPHGRQKQLVNINIEFANPRSLGGRGRGRGGRSRGEGRGGSRGTRVFNRGGRSDNSKQSAPRVDDETDFPSLE